MNRLGSLLVAALCLGACHSAKILLMPVPHHSHVNFFSLVGATLQQASHDVRVLTSHDYAKVAQRHGLVAMVPDIKVPAILADEKRHELLLSSGGNPMPLMASVSRDARQYCVDFMENGEAIAMLEREKFDIVLIDSIDPIRCHYMFPYKLGLPYISVSFRHDPWKARIPALPSMEPFMAIYLFEDSPTFLQRLINLAVYCTTAAILPPSAVADDSLITQYIPDKPGKTFSQLYRDSEMWIVNLETVCLDFPRTHALHYQFFGGLGTEPASPLSPDWTEFVSAAKHGLIVVSFGSALKNIPLDILEKMMAAFARLPQRVAMRYDGPQSATTADNVRLAKWLPQNDLLGRNETKLFITHSGNNGQLEALYHAVPMLGIPIFGDQVYNAQRVTLHGFGLHLDFHSFTSDELYEHITEIIRNPKYKKAIVGCSAIFRSLPDPRESLAFWVDHVVQHGGGHLKPRFMNTPLWRFFMLDVLVVLLLIIVLVILLSCCCCYTMTRRCRGWWRRNKATKRD